MLRTAALCLGLVACNGTIEGIGTGEVTGDDPGPDAGAAVDNATSDATPAAACDNAVTTTNDGKHKPGEPCLQCHTAGGEGPAFTMGGTLYTGAASTTPIAGATIHAVDGNGVDVKLVTALNGNFWTNKTIVFPVTVRASRCPDTKAMIAPVATAGGNCNMGGCHGTGARVYLP